MGRNEALQIAYKNFKNVVSDNLLLLNMLYHSYKFYR